MKITNTPYATGMRINVRKLGIFLILVFICMGAKAQFRSNSSEIGFSIGAANLLGDLGGSQHVGRGFVADLEFAATRPALGIFYRHNFNQWIGVRTNIYYAQVAGNDALINVDENGGGGWSRKYRNLHFKSHILEVSSMLEINFLPYEVGNMRRRFAPYAVVGIGAFHFDPKANLNGQWIQLQPLGTEGQGLPEYGNKQKYSRIALAIPFGAGIKYNINSSYSIGIELAHRITSTDYIDDVSTYYADPAYFYRHYGDEKGALVAALADRSLGGNPYFSAPGAQRGDPSDRDSYTFVGMLTLTYTINSNNGRRGLYCPRGF